VRTWSSAVATATPPMTAPIRIDAVQSFGWCEERFARVSLVFERAGCGNTIRMPPRAVWSGSISFGLVTVPVRLFGAIADHTLHFNYIHEPDGSRIGYEKICKAEGKPVPDDEIVRAFEYEKGEYVVMTEADFDAAKVEGNRTIDIRDFVPYEQIDPILFRHTYYVAPDDGGERTYVLLRDAMQDAGLAGIAKFVMRDRQNLGCLRVREGVLTLEQMYFADEVKPAADLAPGDVEVDERELTMARQLIDAFAGDFEPKKYRDTYRDTLCEIIKAKREGEEIVTSPAEEPEQPTDLMAALRASIAAAQGRREPAGAANGDLAELSKGELYERAKEADVPGRSQMSRDELLDALRNAA
jgi:DNA end-binding protein Ku